MSAPLAPRRPSRFERACPWLFSVSCAPEFVIRFVPAGATAHRGRPEGPGQHSYERHLTAMTCGYVGDGERVGVTWALAMSVGGQDCPATGRCAGALPESGAIRPGTGTGR